MSRASATASAGTWREPAGDSGTLDFDDRRRRRIALTGDGGLSFLLDLPDVPSLRDGDAVVLDDGRHVLVRAAPETLLEIEASDARHLARLAWHLGNRHLPVEVSEGSLRIRNDHVIADMVRQLGARAAVIEAPFNPEGGAYGHGRTHGHDHG